MKNNTIAQAEWNVPIRILLGEGRINDIEAQLDYYGFKSPLIICDKKLVNGIIVKNILRKLDSSKYSFGVFSKDINHVCDKLIKYSQDIIDQGGFDCIIAYGSSVMITLARLVGKQKHIPIIIVPVTAGDTREFLNYAFSYQGDKKEPKICLHSLVYPKLVIFDTVIASKQNKAVLVDSALAILVCAIETWCAGGFNPITDNLSLEAAKIIFTQLSPLINNPSHTATHAHVFSAAVMAGFVAAEQLGASTALAQSLSFLYGVPYGKIAVLLLPHVLNHNLEALDSRLIDLADHLGFKGGSMGLAKALLKLRRMSDIPSKLTDLLGVAKMKGSEKRLIEQMVTHHSLANSNMRLSKKATLAILEAAIAGKIKRA